jgi:hypothetical protein
MINFDVTVAITIILFLALFPMAFIWLRRAYRIFLKKNYAEVALKNGDPPENPEKFALYTGMVNLVAGSVAVIIILGVAAGLLEYKVWSTMAGLTIWIKVFADFIVSRQAHPYKFGKDTIKKPADPVKK